MSFPRYPAYKDSGVEWLGQVPEHWDVRRLRVVAKFNPSKAEAQSLAPETVVSFLPMEAIGEDGSLDLTIEKRLDEVTSGYSYFRDGDVAVAKITPCFENGKGALMSGLSNGAGFGTTELVIARPHPGHVSGSFLHYLFISGGFRGIGESHMFGAGGQKRVPETFFKNFKAALPPVAEQTLVVRCLEKEVAKIDALVAEQQDLIDLLKEKRQAVISHAVTKGLNPDAPMKPSGIDWLGDVPAHWEVKPLRHFSCLVQSGPFGSQLHADEYVVGGTPVINPVNLVNGSIVPTEEISVTAEVLKRLSHQILQAGDVVFSRRGELGRCALVTAAEAGWLCGTGSMILRLYDKEFNPAYLSLLLSASLMRQYFQSLSVGSTMDSLSSSTLLATPMVLPPIDEQGDIVTFVGASSDCLDELTTQAQRAIDLLRERRTALISAAVTGQIDVRPESMRQPA